LKKHRSKSSPTELFEHKRSETVISPIKFQVTYSISGKSISVLNAMGRFIYIYRNACNVDARLVVRETGASRDMMYDW
jgi:hypothetical protein